MDIIQEPQTEESITSDLIQARGNAKYLAAQYAKAEEHAADMKRQLTAQTNYVADLESALRLSKMPIETHCSPRCESCEG
jgi:hypothetical protein